MSTKIVEIPFVSGVDTAGDPSAVGETGKLQSALNLQISPTHKSVLSRRPGTIANPKGNFDYCGAATVSDVGGIPSVLTTFGIWRQRTDGTPGVQQITRTPTARAQRIATLGIGQDEYVVAQGRAQSTDGLSAIDWVAGYNQTAGASSLYARTYYNGIPQAVKRVGSIGITAATTPVFAYYDSATLIWWLVFSDGTNIKRIGHVANSDANDWGSLTTIVAGVRVLDAVLDPQSGRFLVLYVTAAGNAVLASINVATHAVAATTTVQTAPTAPTWGTVAQNVNGSTLTHVMLGGAAADNQQIRPYSVVVGSAATVGAVIASPFGTTPVVKYATAGTPGDGTSRIYIAYDRAATATVPESTIGQLYSISAALTVSAGVPGYLIPCGRLWCSTAFQGTRIFGTSARTVGCWELSIGSTVNDQLVNPVVTYGALRGWGARLNQGNSGCYISGGTAEFAVPIVLAGPYSLLDAGPYLSATEIVRVTDDPVSVVNHAGFSMITGGAPNIWDGSRQQSAGITQPPVVVFSVAATTGFIAAGVYLYAVCYEWIDGLGRRQQSAPTLATVTHAVGSTNKTTIGFAEHSMPYDSRRYTYPGMSVVVYRSTVGGSVLHRGPIAQSIEVIGTIADTYADASYASGEILGTTDLVASAVESSGVIVGFADRFLGVSDAYPNQIWYSKSLQVGRSVEYNQALTFAMPSAITGLAAQDGNVYAFSADAIYAFSPNFADDTGAGGGAPDVYPISPGLGCSEPLSICATPIGLMFLGDRGMQLIPRGGGQPVFIGEAVDRFTAAMVSGTDRISGSAYNAATQEVFFVITSAVASTILVYHTGVNQWTHWQLDSGSFDLGGGVAVVGGTTYFGERSSQRILLELSGALDNTSAIDAVIETRDFSFSNFGEQQRVRSVALDCQGVSGATIYVEESTDSGATWQNLTNIAIDGGSVVYQVQNQKASRHRFKITGVGTSPGEAYQRFAGLSVETVVLSKTNRVAAPLKKG